MTLMAVLLMISFLASTSYRLGHGPELAQTELLYSGYVLVASAQMCAYGALSKPGSVRLWPSRMAELLQRVVLPLLAFQHSPAPLCSRWTVVQRLRAVVREEPG
jgi:hypothetical protein